MYGGTQAAKANQTASFVKFSKCMRAAHSMPFTAFITATMLNCIANALREYEADEGKVDRTRERARRAAALLESPILRPLLGDGALTADGSAVLVVNNRLVLHARHAAVATPVTLMRDGRDRVPASTQSAAETCTDAADDPAQSTDEASASPTLSSQQPSTNSSSAATAAQTQRATQPAERITPEDIPRLTRLLSRVFLEAAGDDDDVEAYDDVEDEHAPSCDGDTATAPPSDEQCAAQSASAGYMPNCTASALGASALMAADSGTQEAKDPLLARSALLTQLGVIGIYVVSRVAATPKDGDTDLHVFTCTCTTFSHNRRTVVPRARTCAHILRARMSILQEPESNLIPVDNSDKDVIVIHDKPPLPSTRTRAHLVQLAAQRAVTAALRIQHQARTAQDHTADFSRAVHEMARHVEEVERIGQWNAQTAAPQSGALHRARKHVHQDAPGQRFGKRQDGSRAGKRAGIATGDDDDDEGEAPFQYVDHELQKKVAKRPKKNKPTPDEIRQRGIYESGSILARVDIMNVSAVPAFDIDASASTK